MLLEKVALTQYLDADQRSNMSDIAVSRNSMWPMEVHMVPLNYKPVIFQLETEMEKRIIDYSEFKRKNYIILRSIQR